MITISLVERIIKMIESEIDEAYSHIDNLFLEIGNRILKYSEITGNKDLYEDINSIIETTLNGDMDQPITEIIKMMVDKLDDTHFNYIQEKQKRLCLYGEGC